MANGLKAPQRKVIGLACLLFLLAVSCRASTVASRATGDPSFPDPTEGRHFGLMILLFGGVGVTTACRGRPMCFLRWVGLPDDGAIAHGRSVRHSCLALGLTTWLLNSFSRHITFTQ